MYHLKASRQILIRHKCLLFFSKLHCRKHRQRKIKMVEVINGQNILDTEAEYIVCLTTKDENSNTQLDMFEDKYPHIWKEYSKFLKHWKKSKSSESNLYLNNIQFVPIDSWALVMCDTYKNEQIVPYDKKYQYVCNVPNGLCKDERGKLVLDINVFERHLIKIHDIAKENGGSVAIKWINEFSNPTIYHIIEKVFSDNVRCLLYK